MTSGSILQRRELREHLDRIGTADIVVGIPSYNNARTIGHVVRAVQAGLAKYFPEARSVLVNSDGGSADGTPQVVQEAGIEDLRSLLIAHRTVPWFKISTPYHGIPGKGSAFRAIFEIAGVLGAKACAVVDSDLRSITPEWVELLVRPVHEGRCHFVAPYYLRHKYDGTITNSIVYPLTRALYGKRVRQPIGGDFGFSGELARFYLGKDVWETDVARYGIDIWMTTTALANGYSVCQSFLGAKIHDAKDPGADLSAMLFQVVGATFGLMEDYAERWRAVTGSEPVETLGFPFEVGLEPVAVNLPRMVDAFRLGVRELGGIWEAVLPAEDLAELRLLAAAGVEDFSLPDELWARIVYAFATAQHRRVMNAAHLLRSFTPLYLGRTASFVIETRESGSAEVEERIDRLCRVFEQTKPRLVAGWS